MIVNFCARGTLRGSGILGLSFATLLNVAIGFTPWVDNFMHLGGVLAGLLVGSATFAQAKRDRAAGIKSHTRSQECVSRGDLAVQAFLALVFVLALLWADLRTSFRSCKLCSHINCIPTPMWSCCATALKGSCGGSVAARRCTHT